MVSKILNNIIDGGPDPANYTGGYNSLGEYCLKRLAEHGDKIVLIDGVSGDQMSATQLRNNSIRVAECLSNFIQAGDIIGICADNCMEFVSIMFGTFMCGATLSPMNATYTERELDHAFNLSKPKIVFASEATWEKVVKVAQTKSFIRQIVIFGYEDAKFVDNNISSYNEFINNKSVNSNFINFNSQPRNIDEDIGLILYSSGTTGLPKGVKLSQKNILIAIAQYYNSDDRDLENTLVPEKIVLCLIPWFHTFGCHVLIGTATRGSQMVFLRKFEEQTFLGGIQKYKVNSTFLVPPLMVFLAKHPVVSKYDLSSLKIILCGAAPLSKETEDAVRKRLNIPIIRQGYGMTEGTVGFSSQSDTYHTSGSVGIVNAGTLCRIVDVETGRLLNKMEQGELQFRGSTVMKGYIGDEKATAMTIDADGWLHTGDIGYYNENGELFIVDRLKELIKYKGFQVPPAEVEGLLLQHPKISDAGVIGVPDETAGELPLAFVVPQPNAQITEREIIDFIKGIASPAKQLHGGVRFVSSIPKTASGKILRRELKQLLEVTRSKL